MNKIFYMLIDFVFRLLVISIFIIPFTCFYKYTSNNNIATIFNNPIINPIYIKITIIFSLIVIISVISYTILNKNINVFNYLIKNKLRKITYYKISEKENKIWSDIVSLIETTHHTSIINKIKRLNLEDKLFLPNFNFKYDFNTTYLHKINEYIILFELILEKLNHKSIFENKKDKNLKNEIKKYKKFLKEGIKKATIKKSSFELCLIIYHSLYLLVPFAMALILSYQIEDISYFHFFAGITIIIFSIPFLRIIKNLIKIIIIDLLEYYNLIFKIAFMIISSGVLIFVVLYSLSLLSKDNLPTNEFRDLFYFFKSLLLNSDIESINHIIKKDYYANHLLYIKDSLLIIKIIIWITITIAIYSIIDYFTKKYDQFYYEQNIKRYLLPPDLFKILLVFILVVVSMFNLYIITTNKVTIPNPVVNIDKTYKADHNMTKYSIDSNSLLILKQEVSKLKEKKSWENLLPFGLFVTLLGTLLAYATRDVMENYFTGLSMKIDNPYEEGDRVKIDNYGMLEVREQGTRSDKFYEIDTNSILTIPHKKLSQSDIKNFTYPNLNYREKITVYKEIKKIEQSTIPREIEKVLLLSAFINTGVKLPKIINEDTDKIKNIAQQVKTFYLNYDKNNCSNFNDNSDIRKKIVEVWEEITKLSNKDILFEKLFIKNFPIHLIEKNNKEGKDTSFLIKKTIIAIIISVIDFQEEINKLNIHCDSNGIRRKYDIFKNATSRNLNKISTILVNISFYYYMLSKRLWELKDKQLSIIQKRKIDKLMAQILDVPRVTSTQYLDNATPYWKATLLVTLELSEQSDETIHHINMYIDELWDKFLNEKENKFNLTYYKLNL